MTQQNRHLFFISGMWCSTCSTSVINSVRDLEGIQDANLDFSTKLLKVVSNQDIINIDEQIKSKIESLGFRAKLQDAGWVEKFHKTLSQESDRSIPWTMLFLVGFLSMWSTMFSLVNYIGGNLSNTESYYIAILSTLFGAPAVFLGLIPFSISGFKAMFYSRTLTLDIFISLGGIATIAISILNLFTGSKEIFVDSGAMIITILLLSKKIEMVAANSITNKILFNISAMNSIVFKKQTNGFSKANTSQIRECDTVFFEKDSTISFDGILLSDNAITDEHLLTGESSIIKKSKGDTVSAGSIARSEILLEVTAPLGHRNIDQWIENSFFPETSSNYNFLNKIEPILVYISLLGASTLAVSEYMHSYSVKNLIEGFFIGVLVFCPCLFAIIIPLSRKAVSVSLKNLGIEAINPDALLRIPNLEHFYFDKTGTLEAVTSEFIPAISSFSKNVEPYLELACKKSTHPILTNLNIIHQPQNDCEIVKVSDLPGYGSTFAFKSGELLSVGNEEYLRRLETKNLPPLGSFRTFVSLNGIYRGEIYSSKTILEKSFNTLKRLLNLKRVRSINILSGDPTIKNGNKFENLDDRLKYFGNLKPTEKANKIQNGSIFVGDGLNDTLALSKADVSVRINPRVYGFSQVDFQIMSADISKFNSLMIIARKYRRTIWQTFFLAFSYNIVAITLAFNGVFTPLSAVLSMFASTLILFLSISRIFYFRGDLHD